MRLLFKIALILGTTFNLYCQTTINIHLDSIGLNIGSKYQPGVFYVPKTTDAQNDFLNNGIKQNAIRLNIIELALNNSSNLDECLTYLDGVSTILRDISDKTDRVLLFSRKSQVG